MVNTGHLTALGSRIDGALTWDQLESFNAPESIVEVEFVTHEVTALCPVTNQPDLYTVQINYVPNKLCVESKTLKLFLLQWRNVGVFGESIADIICTELNKAIEPIYISVKTTQQIRGGLQMTSTAEIGAQ